MLYFKVMVGVYLILLREKHNIMILLIFSIILIVFGIYLNNSSGETISMYGIILLIISIITIAANSAN